MNQTVALIIFLLVVFGIVWFMIRSTQRQIKRVMNGERSLDDRDIWLRHTKPVAALILGKRENTDPKAIGIAKVDLELEIPLPENDPIRTTASWLVEIPYLPQLQVGGTVEVKFDPKKPGRVFPAVPWARLWVFGK
jgi:hypothetical protein